MIMSKTKGERIDLTSQKVNRDEIKLNYKRYLRLPEDVQENVLNFCKAKAKRQLEDYYSFVHGTPDFNEMVRFEISEYMNSIYKPFCWYLDE